MTLPAVTRSSSPSLFYRHEEVHETQEFRTPSREDRESSTWAVAATHSGCVTKVLGSSVRFRPTWRSWSRGAATPFAAVAERHVDIGLSVVEQTKSTEYHALLLAGKHCLSPFRKASDLASIVHRHSLSCTVRQRHGRSPRSSYSERPSRVPARGGGRYRSLNEHIAEWETPRSRGPRSRGGHLPPVSSDIGEQGALLAVALRVVGSATGPCSRGRDSPTRL